MGSNNFNLCKRSDFKDPSFIPGWTFLIGIESRIEQVIANLLDNAISFSSDKQTINIDLSETTTSFVLIIKDQGPGFAETSTNKIFTKIADQGFVY